jgi:hypothetical protein
MKGEFMRLMKGQEFRKWGRVGVQEAGEGQKLRRWGRGKS